MRKLSPLLSLAVCSLSVQGLAQDASPAADPAAGAKAPSVSASAAKDHQNQLLRFQERIAALTRRIEVAEGGADALKSSALSGMVVRTRATIVHKNELASGLVMDQVTYILDGNVILQSDNKSGQLSEDVPLQLFNGPIRAGPHEIQVQMRVRGEAFGPFTYLEGYKFNIKSKYVFQVIDGRTNLLSIVAAQKDDITLEPQDRLTVRYDVDIVDSTKAAKR